MRIVELKQPERRFDAPEITNLGIQAYGADNLYPQMIRAVLAASSTGKVCAKRYARFIEGGGFKNAAVYGMAVNAAGDTADDILRLMAKDMADLGGFALHVNYNVLGQIVSLAHVPFESCRLTLPDDTGYIGKVAVHPDWSGKSKRNGKQLKPTIDTVDYIDVFAPQFALIQIAASEDISQYKGQILYCSMDGSMVYPTPVADEIITDLSSSEGLSNVRHRNIRNGFLPGGMFCKKKSISLDDDRDEDAEFFDALKKFQGDTAAGKLFGCTYEEGEEPPIFKPFETNNYDKEFEFTEATVKDMIYSAFEQEPFLRISSGALGFSTEIVAQAYQYYGSLVRNEQILIERAFTKVFTAWHEPMANDYTILPKQYNGSFD